MKGLKDSNSIFNQILWGLAAKKAIVKNQKISIARRIEKTVNSDQFFAW